MGTVFVVISGLGIFLSVGVFIVSLVSKIIFLIAKKEEKKKKANKGVVISAIGFGVFLIAFITTIIVGPKLDPVGWCSHAYCVVEQHDSTCTKNGYIKKVCSNCNDEIIEYIDAQHSWIEDSIIAATCSHPKQLINKCSVCGTTEKVEEGSTIPHSFGEWIVTIVATAEKEGQQERKCTVCQYVENESIPKISYIEITANDLWNAFDENEINAEQKFNGKIIRVTGIISDINSAEAFVDANVLLVVDNSYFGCVQCNFDSKNAAALADLHKGESVTIEGTCGTLSLYNLMVRSCKVIE